MGYEPIPWTIADNEGWKSAWMIPAIKAGKNWDQCQKLESVDRKKERKEKKKKLLCTRLWYNEYREWFMNNTRVFTRYIYNLFIMFTRAKRNGNYSILGLELLH